MDWHGDRWAIPSLVVSVAVLLLAGGWAAIAVSGGGGSATTIAAGGRQVGATGLGHAALPDDEAPAGSSTVTVGPLTVGTTAPAPGGPMTTTTPTGVVLPPTPPLPMPLPTKTSPSASVLAPPPVPGPTTTLLPAARTNSWSANANGVTVRMRMEPAAPVAGQPVTFFVDNVSAPLPCCVVHISFGDGTAMPVGGSNCDNPTVKAGMVATHTYAAPGAYEIRLVVVTFPCRPTTGDGPVQPTITGTDIRACIAVGPGTVPDHCAPVEHFRPSAG